MDTGDMGRCASCRHWADDGTCDRITGTNDEDDEAGLWPEEAELQVSADFGCTLWEGDEGEEVAGG